MKYARLIQILAGQPIYMYVHPQDTPEKVVRLRIAGVWKNPRGCFHVRGEKPEYPGTTYIFGQIDPGDDFFVPVTENPLDEGQCMHEYQVPHVIKCLDLKELED